MKWKKWIYVMLSDEVEMIRFKVFYQFAKLYIRTWLITFNEYILKKLRRVGLNDWFFFFKKRKKRKVMMMFNDDAYAIADVTADNDDNSDGNVNVKNTC